MGKKQATKPNPEIVWKDMGYVNLESVHGQLGISTCGKLAELVVETNMLNMYQLHEIQREFDCEMMVEAVGLFVGYEEVGAAFVIHMSDVKVTAATLMRLKGIDLEI
jgi:hypothetical protein